MAVLLARLLAPCFDPFTDLFVLPLFCHDISYCGVMRFSALDACPPYSARNPSYVPIAFVATANSVPFGRQVSANCAVESWFRNSHGRNNVGRRQSPGPEPTILIRRAHRSRLLGVALVILHDRSDVFSPGKFLGGLWLVDAPLSLGIPVQRSIIELLSCRPTHKVGLGSFCSSDAPYHVHCPQTVSRFRPV